MARMPVLQLTLLVLQLTLLEHVDKMLAPALSCGAAASCAQEDGRELPVLHAALAAAPLLNHIHQHQCSSTSTSCWWAALASIAAAPCLLCHRPPCLPVCKSCITVIRRRCCNACNATTATLICTALAMNSAAPFFLGHRPPCLPVRESVSTIVRIGWSCWHDRLHWWHDWLHCRPNYGLRATSVVHSAAPLPLVFFPGVLRINRTVERIHGPRWC